MEFFYDDYSFEELSEAAESAAWEALLAACLRKQDELDDA